MLAFLTVTRTLGRVAAVARPSTRCFRSTPSLFNASGADSKTEGAKIPVNIFIDKEDPVVLADDQYPDWLWNDVLNLPSFEELHEKALNNELTWENGGKRYFKLLNRRKIKEQNAAGSI